MVARSDGAGLACDYARNRAQWQAYGAAYVKVDPAPLHYLIRSTSDVPINIFFRIVKPQDFDLDVEDGLDVVRGGGGSPSDVGGGGHPAARSEAKRCC
jgi:hypothetical protein